MIDVREELRDLVCKAQSLHKRERAITLESIDLVGSFDRRNAAVNLGMSSEDFARLIGLSPSVFWKRAQVARVITRFPKARELLDSGVTEVSQLSLAASKITEANSELILAALKHRSKREVEAFLSRVTPDGRLREQEGEVELKIRLSETQLKTLDRAREVLAAGGKVPALAEIFLTALGDLLTRRDPLAKAERAVKRQAVSASLSPIPQTRKSVASPAKRGEDSELNSVCASPGKRADQRTKVPAKIEHQVRLRDKGQCTWIYPDRSRCPEKMMIELDHLQMICRGGQHSVDNLTSRCRHHNQYRAEQELGKAFMSRWTNNRASSVTTRTLSASPLESRKG